MTRLGCVGAAGLALLLLPTAHLARAQTWCGEDCLGVEIDAQLGLESLEEPVADQVEPEANGYATLYVASLLQVYQLQAVIQAPLRFDIDDFGIRKADWDQTEEYLRIVRCARVDFMNVSEAGAGDWYPTRYDEGGGCRSWTPTEQVGDIFREGFDFTYYSLRLAPLRNFTLGYGSIVDNYNATIEEDFYREGLTFEVNLNRRFLATIGLSDIVDPTVLAARTAFRPVHSQSLDGGYGEPRTELFTEIGATVATDLRAPTLLTGSGEREEEGLVIGGLDAKLRWSSIDDYTRDSYRIMRFEVGGRYNQIFSRDAGVHTHLRFYYDVGPVDFYVDGEYRLVNGRYIPNYFNQHYRVQREQFPLSDAQRTGLTETELQFTKLDALNRLPDDAEHAYASNLRLRFWPWSAEQSAWTQDGADLWLFIEQIPGRDASGRAGVGLTLHNIADKLRVWGEFVQQGWDTIGGIFDLSNSVLDINTRIILTDQIYLDLYFAQSWFQLEDGNYSGTNDLGFNLGFQESL